MATTLRSAGLILMGLVTAMAILALATASGRQPTPRQGGPDPVIGHEPSMPTTARMPGDVDDAVEALERFLEIIDHELQVVDGDLGDAGEIATGEALGELDAAVQEYSVNEWRQTGSSRLARSRTLATAPGDPPRSIRVEACIEFSDVEVVDQSGRSVTTRPANQPSRMPHIYTIVLSGNTWKVARHTFPNAATC